MNKIIYLFFLLFIISCSQNRSKGQLAYDIHCANCHGENGEGLVTLYPSLAKDRIQDLRNSIPCIIEYGIQKGDPYHTGKYPFPMPPNPQLISTDIVNITNYILSEFGDQKQIISPQEIETLLDECENE